MFSVFEYPELERTDAKLVFPHYTSLEPKTVEDIRHVTAVEGTELTLLCRLNKDVATAQLVDAEGQAIELEAARRWQARLQRDHHARRPAAVPRPVGRPRRAYQQAGDRDRGQRHAEPSAGRQDDPAGPRRCRSRRSKSSSSRPSSKTISAWCVMASATAWRAASPARSSCQVRRPRPAVAPRAHARLRVASMPRPTSFSPISSGPRTSARTASRGGHPATCSSPRSGRSRRSSARASSPRADRPRTKSKRANKAMPRRATSWRNCKRKSSTAPGS